MSWWYNSFFIKKRKIRNAIGIWRPSRGILIQPSITKLLLMKTFKKGISIISYLWFKARQNEPSKNVVTFDSFLPNLFVITSIKRKKLNQKHNSKMMNDYRIFSKTVAFQRNLSYHCNRWSQFSFPKMFIRLKLFILFDETNKA